MVIIDYGIGNLFSLVSSLKFIGVDATVSGEKAAIERAERIILPGVGAFADAAEKLRDSGLGELICEMARAGVPVMGICLGMQLLFYKSYEYGEHAGLSLISGKVKPISDVIPTGYKIPHIGWNSLHLCGKKHPIFKYISENDFVYFVHSFYADECSDSLIATSEYGAELTAAVACKNVCGCQFHPEKSGDVGLSILRGFCEWDGSEI